MKTLTVFTPTFNRAHTLPRVYQSLLRQSSKDFTWIVVDDGSTDNTESMVRQWIAENPFPIEYIYQKNAGMISAHNTALKRFSSDLAVCLDSDDYFTDDAVETILRTWNEAKDNPLCGGLVGLDIHHSGEVVGDSFPVDREWLTFMDIRFRHRIRGDKKYVMSRAALAYAGLYPDVPGERFPAASYLYRVIGRKYQFVAINAPLCVVEYLPDGNTHNKTKQYKKSPNAFMLFRELCMDYPYNFKEKFTSSIHFVSSALFSKNYSSIFSNSHSALTIATLPLGVALWTYINIKGFSQNKLKWFSL